MNTYKIETTITKDGKIILPPNLHNIFNHKVEVVLLDKEDKKNIKNKLNIPTYKCDGKVIGFTREELYESRL